MKPNKQREEVRIRGELVQDVLDYHPKGIIFLSIEELAEQLKPEDIKIIYYNKFWGTEPPQPTQEGNTYCNCMICQGGIQKCKPLKKECKLGEGQLRALLYSASQHLPEPKPERIEELNPNDWGERWWVLINKINEIAEKFNHLTRGK